MPTSFIKLTTHNWFGKYLRSFQCFHNDERNSNVRARRVVREELKEKLVFVIICFISFVRSFEATSFLELELKFMKNR